MAEYSDTTALANGRQCVNSTLERIVRVANASASHGDRPLIIAPSQWAMTLLCN
jgi:hypothetical protein